MKTSALRVVDLCCGSGGFSLALKPFQATTVWANDCLPESAQLFKANFPESQFVLGDLNQPALRETIPEHDILCAGFPCQPFSVAGQRQGFSDPRTQVIWSILEVAERRRPELILLENVPGLVSHQESPGSRSLHQITDHLRTLGYSVAWGLLHTAEVTGIPHNRRRLYIVADRLPGHWDLHVPRVVCPWRIEPFLQEVPMGSKYRYSDRYKIWPTLQAQIVRPVSQQVVYQYRRGYVRQSKHGLVPTLTANMGTGGHNVPLILDEHGIRKLTPRECFNFQGFPSTYQLPKSLSDGRLYKLAGNAITVPVVTRLMKSYWSTRLRLIDSVDQPRKPECPRSFE